MKLNPTSTYFWTKERIRRTVFAVLLIAVACFIPFRKRTQPVREPDAAPGHTFSLYTGTDTLTYDVTGWDSVRIDSLLRSFVPENTTYDDSIAALYLKNLQDTVPNSDTALVNAFLRELEKEK